MLKLDQIGLNQRITDFTAETAVDFGCLLAPLARSDLVNQAGQLHPSSFADDCRRTGRFTTKHHR